MTNNILTPLSACKTAINTIDKLRTILDENNVTALYKEFMHSDGIGRCMISTLNDVIGRYNSPMYRYTEDYDIVGPPVPRAFAGSREKTMSPLKGCELALETLCNIAQLLHDKDIDALSAMFEPRDGFVWKTKHSINLAIDACENVYHYGEVNIAFWPLVAAG